MMLSDVSIRRPVFATVLSLMLVALGLIAFTRLPLRELPNIDPPIVSVDVSYPGASAGVVETRVTQVLEDALSGIEGVETIQSQSRNGRSSITLEFSLNRDIEGAANDVRDAVSRVADRMPQEADAPQVAKVEGDADVILWLNLSSPQLDSLALTDYAGRYIVDRLSSIDGVAQLRIGGSQRYAMRIWLDRDALAARGLTIAEVEAALRAENVELPAGRLESDTRDFTLRIDRGYVQTTDFEALPLRKGADGHVIRLAEVARVAIESTDRRAMFRGNGTPQIGLGVIKTSTANSLDVANLVKAEVERINEGLPEGMKIGVTFDSTIFIDEAVKQVYKTLFEATLLVVLVIWLFLGSVRAALVPAVTVPVCLIASFIALWMFGFSINLLTLLALVLSIGLVVDDAIVVLENAQRRADLGEPVSVAALRGTRQVAFAVIATTTVLVAVFVPVSFIEGNNGRLFRELAVALAAAVAISAFVALTLTPMMCSLLLRRHGQASGFSERVDERLNALAGAYRRVLERVIGHPKRWVLFMLVALAGSYGLSTLVPRELAPPEDRGAFFLSVVGPEGAGFDYTASQVLEVEKLLLKYTGEGQPIERVNIRVPGGFGASEEMHTGQGIVVLKPFGQRDLSTNEVVEQVRADMNAIAGVRGLAQVRQGLVRSQGQPFQVVIGGPDYAELANWRDRLMARMEKNPGLSSVDSDFKETRPQIRVSVDRNRAAALGVSLADIGRTLETMMGSRRVTTYVEDGEEYDVILQAERDDRAAPSDLRNLYVRARSGELIPLGSVVSLSELAEPGSLNRFNRLRAITVSAAIAPGYTLGQAIEWISRTAKEELPQTAQIDFKGESREYQQSGSAVLFTFALALLVVYLVLAAQFESFVHPLVIMLTVPLAVFGAFVGLAVTGNTLNLFSQIGIIMLIGLAAKNGILIVEFANQRRDAGRSVRDAVLEAASTRLRPILMTSIATAAGALPLVLANGPGSASRATIGVVVAFGVTLSTFLSLFVVPAFYLWLAPYTRSPEEKTRELEQLEHATPPVEK
ncbi:MAG TPA: efflux RND transporter permease subunit [Pseudomonadota bacterium]|nr:efflux RND transporter permease subunit [Rhodanobacteraceae bacterium]MBP9155002.1 efflux RND transporter permease subunit [Xanthomonadales bacterium]HQW82384.1 efflux RND transporter permease subunit [Pseudomonadota bacterium]